MKILAKVTFKQGEKIKSLTLKVDGAGDEAELEIVLDESQIEHLGEATPIYRKGNERPMVIEEKETVEEVPVSEKPVAANVKDKKEDEAQNTHQEEQTTIVYNDVSEEISAHEEARSVPEEPEKENKVLAQAEGEPAAVLMDQPKTKQPSRGKERKPTTRQSGKGKERKSKTKQSEKWNERKPKTEGEEKITKVAEIAAKSSNFEEFVQKVADWLELEDKNRNYFVEVVKATRNISQINWSNIESVLKEKVVVWGPYNKIQISKRVTKKFEELGVNVQIMTLIKEMATYWDWKFVPQKSVSQPKPNVEGKANADQPTDIPKENHDSARVKMACMPDIPWFEEKLANMDKTRAIETRVRYVLEAMGMENQDILNPVMMFDIANAAVKSSTLSDSDLLNNTKKQETCLKGIFLAAGIDEHMHIMVRMKFTSFVNSFIEKNAVVAKPVKLIQFLSELRKFVTS